MLNVKILLVVLDEKTLHLKKTYRYTCDIDIQYRVTWHIQRNISKITGSECVHSSVWESENKYNIINTHTTSECLNKLLNNDKHK